MTSQQQLVCDNSTLANFKQWAQPISAFFATAGWVQTTDTGQVNWSTISSVPGSAAFVYEIWKPGDALTAFYVKVEYGNVSGTNCPSLRLTISTGTNGAGTPTGFIMGPLNTNTNGYTPPSTTTQFECDFSGTASRICVMMWRNGTGSCQQFFGIERSVNSSGAYTGAHVTLIVCGTVTAGGPSFVQQTLLFGVGVAPISNENHSGGNGHGGLIVRMANTSSANSSVFNGAIPFDTTAPSIGYYDYGLTMAGCACATDISEGVTFTVTLYGSTVTYMPSKNSTFGSAGPSNSAGAFCMRYD
jgi:hypothetical protein